MIKKESEVTQSCPTLPNPMDCSPPCSSVHGIFQVRVLEWVAISSSRGSSQPRDRTQVSHVAGRCFTAWAIREAWSKWSKRITKICQKQSIFETLNIFFISGIKHGINRFNEDLPFPCYTRYLVATGLDLEDEEVQVFLGLSLLTVEM